ncbi:MAG: hypothetical protein ABI592_08715 [Acidobacteriota bacterium]
MTRVKGRSRILRKLLTCSVFSLAASALSASSAGGGPVPDASEWASSPFRNFGAAVPVASGRLEVFDEGDDPGFRASLSSELKRLRFELHERQGWADPIAAGDPLRVFVARKEAQDVRRFFARAVDRHRLVHPAIEIDASGLDSRQVVHEIARLYALATLNAYGAPDSTFLTDAVAETLSADSRADETQERLRIAAAAPLLDLGRHRDSLGRVYVEEFTRAAGGPGSLRALWERAALSGESVLPLLLHTWTDATGEREEALLLRAAARLYTLVESEPLPSRLTLADLEGGALDAATPATFSVRHRSLVPAADATGALRISWPDRGAGAAAVVRYRDAALPADVVFWKAGTTHTVPLAGIARVDWVIAGTPGGPPLEAIPATVEAIAAFPAANVAAQAAAGPGGTRVWWTTSGHEGLAGWALFREEVQADGRIVRTGPQILPSTLQADDSFRYAYVDPDTSPGTFYRYSVWAVTDDGLLARAFSATLRTSD